MCLKLFAEGGFGGGIWSGSGPLLDVVRPVERHVFGSGDWMVVGLARSTRGVWREGWGRVWVDVWVECWTVPTFPLRVGKCNVD